jgi:hypothetical protein
MSDDWDLLLLPGSDVPEPVSNHVPDNESSENIMSDDTFRSLLDDPPTELCSASVLANLVTQYLTSDWQNQFAPTE